MNDKAILYATNLISEIVMNKSLSVNNNKLIRIKEIIEYDTKNEFEFLKIYFFNEERDEGRTP